MDKKDNLLKDSENLNKMVALIDALPQLKLKLPRPKNLNLGEVGEVPYKGKTVTFEVQEDLNGKKIWMFKRTKQNEK